MGIFDRYRQTNSTQINQYAGAPVQEMANVGMHLQSRYDVNRDQLDVLGRTLSSSAVLDQDRALLEEELSGVREGLRGAIEKGNYEDMSHQVRMLGRDFTEKYSPFERNYSLMQARLKEIEDNKDISANTKELLKRELADYGGLRRGPDGRLGGFYSGQSIAKDVNMDEFTRKALEGMMANTYGSEGFSIESAGGGEYFVQSGGKRTSISPDRVRAAVRQAAMLNPEVGSYLAQNARLNTRGFENLSYEQASQLGGDRGSLLADRAKELAESRNIPFGQAFRSVAQQAMVEDVLGASSEYGVNSKAYENVDSFTRIGKETANSEVANAGRKAAAAKIPEDRFVLPGGLRGDGKETDVKTMTRDLNKISGDIKTLQANLEKSTDPADRAMYQGQLDQLNEQRSRAKELLSTVAKESLSTLPDKIDIEVMPASYKNVSGFAKSGASGKKSRISKAALETAMTNGNFKVTGNVVEIRLKDGSYAVIKENGSSLGRTAANTLTSLNSPLAKAVGTALGESSRGTGASRQVLDAIKNFDKGVRERTSMGSFSSNQVSMSNSEASAVKNLYQGASDAFEVYSASNPGKPLEEKPVAIDFSTFEPITDGGEVVLRGQALDEKGKPTGEVVYVKSKPGNNVGSVLTQSLLRDAKGQTTSTNFQVAQAMNTPQIETISKLTPGSSIDMGGVRVEKYLTPAKQLRYRLLDEDGDAIVRSNGDYVYGETAEEGFSLATQFLKKK